MHSRTDQRWHFGDIDSIINDLTAIRTDIT